MVETNKVEAKKKNSSEIWTEGFEKQNTCHTQISGHAEMQLALQYNMRVGTGGAKGPNTQTSIHKEIHQNDSRISWNYIKFAEKATFCI